MFIYCKPIVNNAHPYLQYVNAINAINLENKTITDNDNITSYPLENFDEIIVALREKGLLLNY